MKGRRTGNTQVCGRILPKKETSLNPKHKPIPATSVPVSTGLVTEDGSCLQIYNPAKCPSTKDLESSHLPWDPRQWIITQLVANSYMSFTGFLHITN